MGLGAASSSPARRVVLVRLGLSNHYQRRAQDAVRQAVAFLQHGQHRVGFGVGVGCLYLADGLVFVRIELFA